MSSVTSRRSMCSTRCGTCSSFVEPPGSFVTTTARSSSPERFANGLRTLYIGPGAPWENAYSESFDSRFWDGLLARELFTSLREAKALVKDYRLQYDHRRPHSSLGYQIPAPFATPCARTAE